MSSQKNTIPSAPKHLGWDVKLFNRSFFVSKLMFNGVITLVSIPWMINAWSVLKPVRERKKETGRIQIKRDEALRLFGTDAGILTLGVIMFAVLRSKGGLQVTKRLG